MDREQPEHPPTEAAEKPIERLLQDSSYYLLGNVAGRIVGFLAIPFYSRFLSPAQYGLIELVELSTQTVAIAFGLQAIGAALGRLFHDQDSRQGQDAVVSTSLIATGMLSAVITLLAVLGAGRLSELVFHDQQWTTLLQAAFVAMFFSSMIEVTLVYERIQNRARFFLYYTLFTIAATLALNILFIGVLNAGVWGFVSSKLVVTSGGSMYLMVRAQREVGWNWRSLYVPQLVKFGAPLILSTLSYFAIHFSDRFFLSAVVSLADLGRYALAYRFAILVSALVGDSFTKSWGVTLYRYVGRDQWREQFSQVAAYFSYILFATGLAIALFSPELLRIMVPKSYMPPPLLLPIVILGYLAREIGDFFRALLLINKRSVTVSAIAGGSALVNLGANVVLIPAYGIYGAAVATLVTWAVYMLACWLIANAEHKLPVRTSAYVRLFLLVGAVYAVAAATRSNVFVLQLVFDTVWTLFFFAAAAWVFLSAAERRGLLLLGGTLASRLLMLGAPPMPARTAGPAGQRHVLMLAYYYPPRNEIGAARPHRFATRLERAGTAVTVVTSAGPAAEREQANVVRVPGPAAPLLERAAARGIQMVEHMLLPYDDRTIWLPAAVNAAARHMRPGTVLLSTHPPTVTHLAAMVLKHRYGVPWIADFRDPLLGNPYRTSQRAAFTDPVLERATVENADAVIANTEASAAMLRGRYPAMRDRIHVIWNGYDPEDGLAPGPAPTRRRRVMAHVGSLYGSRTPVPFLAALERLVTAGRLDPGTIQFRQVGRADPSNLVVTSPLVESLTLLGCCHVVAGNLPQAEAWAEMLAAEWLLLLDLNLGGPGLQVPAKTFEYVRTGRPILALAAADSPTAHVLGLSGVDHACIDPALPPDVFDAQVLAFLSRPACATAPGAQFLEEFDAAYQVRQLSRIIEQVAGRKAAD